MRTAADCYVRDDGHQIVRCALRVLADQTARMGPDRIEVAENADTPGRIAPLRVAQDIRSGGKIKKRKR